MTTPIPTLDEVLAPIVADWTIRDLLEWLGADDSRMHDAGLRAPLLVIDAALTGSTWEREPSTVALIRSIASAVQTSPRLRNPRLDDLLDFRIAQMVDDSAVERPLARFERVSEPQLAGAGAAGVGAG
jgi:hypothetical protein